MTVVQVLLSAIVLFLLYRFLLETLGVKLLGVWSIVLATAMTARISELGFSGSVVKFVAKHLALDDVAKVSGIIQTAAVSVFIVIGFVVIAAYYPLINLLAFLIPKKALGDAISILPYALCSLWLNAVAGVFQAGLDGCQRIDLRSWLLMGSTVLYLILAYAFVP
ncbi:MAG: hypothetical protein KAV87_65225, partial [Desulfobacteraceae bacterium]|nr:hypothetical protein [Desulfobacteraceae bacterium]